ncbi:MAG: hypothetical protein ACFB2X_08545, partial [Rivularia sp. (in: cyanobacteria)]
MTSIFFPVILLTNSALAVEGVDKLNNKQLSASGVPQQGTLFNPDNTAENLKLLKVKGIKLQDLSGLDQVQSKPKSNTSSFSHSFGQQVSSPEAENFAVFSDAFASPIEPTSKDDFGLPQEPVVVADSGEGQPLSKDMQERIEKLRNLDKLKLDSYYASPALSVYIPVGYGSHRNTGFVAGSYQSNVRFSNKDDGALGFGVGLGDADKSVGVVISYSAVSFGGSRDFGSGGFNLKVHRRFKGDWSAAIGMNGILNIGDYEDPDIDGVNDFENSLYAVATKIFRTKDDINKPFSRVAVTAGVGNGQFRTEDSFLNDEDNFNVFGNVAVRVHPQASLIAEWTGQDLAVGASIAPFKRIPLVITPAVRDIAGPG